MTELTAIRQSQGNMLRIHGNGEVPVEEVYKFLQALEHAYNSAYVFDLIATQAAELLEQYGDSRPPIPARNLLWMGWWPPTPEKVAAMVPPADKLILAGVELHSPGMWDFSGVVAVLQALFQGITGFFEIRKNRYREPAEIIKLDQEIRDRELEIWRKKIEILKLAGASEQDLGILRHQLLTEPLTGLYQHQDQGLITSAEIVESESKKKRA